MINLSFGRGVLSSVWKQCCLPSVAHPCLDCASELLHVVGGITWWNGVLDSLCFASCDVGESPGSWPWGSPDIARNAKN